MQTTHSLQIRVCVGGCFCTKTQPPLAVGSLACVCCESGQHMFLFSWIPACTASRRLASSSHSLSCSICLLAHKQSKLAHTGQHTKQVIAQSRTVTGREMLYAVAYTHTHTHIIPHAVFTFVKAVLVLPSFQDLRKLVLRAPWSGLHGVLDLSTHKQLHYPSMTLTRGIMTILAERL